MRDAPRSLLVVTPCSARKRARPPFYATFEQLTDQRQREDVERALAAYALPARTMYIGAHHRSVIADVDVLRRAWPDSRVEIAIVSAGYGVLAERTSIIPYDASFSTISTAEARRRGQRLAIGEQLRQWLSSFDCAIVLLSEAYLRATEAPYRADPCDAYFVAPGYRFAGTDVRVVPAGLADARALGVAPRMAQATLFRRFTDAAVRLGFSAAVDAAVAGGLTASQCEPTQLSLLAI